MFLRIILFFLCLCFVEFNSRAVVKRRFFSEVSGESFFRKLFLGYIKFLKSRFRLGFDNCVFNIDIKLFLYKG